MKKRLLVTVLALVMALATCAFVLVGCGDKKSSGGGTTTTTVTVKDGETEVTSLSLKVGDSKTLTAATDPADKKVEWTTSSAKVLALDAATAGKVTAVAPGKATLNVAAEDGSGEVDIPVTVTAEAFYIVGEAGPVGKATSGDKEDSLKSAEWKHYTTAASIPAALKLTKAENEEKFTAQVKLYKGDHFKLMYFDPTIPADSDTALSGAYGYTALDAASSAKTDIVTDSNGNLVVGYKQGVYTITVDATGSSPVISYTVDATGYPETALEYYNVGIRGTRDWDENYTNSPVKIEKDGDNKFKKDIYISLDKDECFQFLVADDCVLNPEWDTFTPASCTNYDNNACFGADTSAGGDNNLKAKAKGVYKFEVEIDAQGKIKVALPSAAVSDTSGIAKGSIVTGVKPRKEHTVKANGQFTTGASGTTWADYKEGDTVVTSKINSTNGSCDITVKVSNWGKFKIIVDSEWIGYDKLTNESDTVDGIDLSETLNKWDNNICLNNDGSYTITITVTVADNGETITLTVKNISETAA